MKKDICMNLTDVLFFAAVAILNYKNCNGVSERYLLIRKDRFQQMTGIFHFIFHQFRIFGIYHP